jgi:hypothetical protein
MTIRELPAVVVLYVLTLPQISRASEKFLLAMVRECCSPFLTLGLGFDFPVLGRYLVLKGVCHFYGVAYHSSTVHYKRMVLPQERDLPPFGRSP